MVDSSFVREDAAGSDPNGCARVAFIQMQMTDAVNYFWEAWLPVIGGRSGTPDEIARRDARRRCYSEGLERAQYKCYELANERGISSVDEAKDIIHELIREFMRENRA